MPDRHSKAVIAGLGQSPLGKTGKTSLQLHALAALDALQDAGISKADVDGVLTVYSLMDNNIMYANTFAEYMGIQPRYCTTMSMGGTTPFSLMAHAMRTIEAGFCNTVLIAAADNRASGAARSDMIARMSQIAHPDYEEPFGPIIPSLYALMAQRHMHEFGTTSEQLAAIAVACRKHAALNPDAMQRQPITVADVVNSRMISSPLHKLDCCLVGDYGGALVVTRADLARHGPKTPVQVLGYGEGHDYQHITQAPSLTSAGCKGSGQRAFAAAGLTPADVDVAQLYDSFTITLLIELEDLGFCAKGEGGPFVAGGGIELGGRLPTNTHGGLLSCTTGGILHLIEAARQVRGEAGDRQVPGAEVALAHGEGGILSAHCTVLLAKEGG